MPPRSGCQVYRKTLRIATLVELQVSRSASPGNYNQSVFKSISELCSYHHGARFALITMVPGFNWEALLEQGTKINVVCWDYRKFDIFISIPEKWTSYVRL